MSRPEVKIIEPQSEELSPLNISREEEEIMIQNFLNRGKSQAPIRNTSISGETFEEMCRRHDEEIRTRKPSRPSDGLNRDQKIIGDDETGINFRVQIVSDMKI
jgi:hypothetical protein